MRIPVRQHLKHGTFELWTERPSENFLQVHQVHGIEIASPDTLPCEADGLISSWEQLTVPLAIKTADCLPIIIEGRKGVVFLHAGWRGLAQGILSRPELKLIDPELAYIGPSIQVCCFQVSQEFKQEFPGSPWFAEKHEQLFFNLQQEAKEILQREFDQLEVQLAAECTCCRADLHSYRRNKTTERNWNIYRKG